MSVEKFIAINRKKVIAEKYNYSLDWVLYSHRINKNSFFRNKKYEEQKGLCLVCNLELINQSKCLHHIDYDNTCSLGEVIKIPTGKITSKGNMRFKLSPNCEKCYSVNIEGFNECSKKLVFVHKNCHSKLHRKII